MLPSWLSLSVSLSDSLVDAFSPWLGPLPPSLYGAYWTAQSRIKTRFMICDSANVKPKTPYDACILTTKMTWIIQSYFSSLLFSSHSLSSLIFDCFWWSLFCEFAKSHRLWTSRLIGPAYSNIYEFHWTKKRKKKGQENNGWWIMKTRLAMSINLSLLPLLIRFCILF